MEILTKLMRWWCRIYHGSAIWRHDSIINITRDTYECGQCGRVHRYDWYGQAALRAGER